MTGRKPSSSGLLPWLIILIEKNTKWKIFRPTKFIQRIYLLQVLIDQEPQFVVIAMSGGHLLHRQLEDRPAIHFVALLALLTPAGTC